LRDPVVKCERYFGNSFQYIRFVLPSQSTISNRHVFGEVFWPQCYSEYQRHNYDANGLNLVAAAPNPASENQRRWNEQQERGLCPPGVGVGRRVLFGVYADAARACERAEQKKVEALCWCVSFLSWIFYSEHGLIFWTLCRQLA
jgi:hypothetical protein